MNWKNFSCKKNQDSQYEYIKLVGTYLIEPKFRLAWCFREGFATVKLNGKWGHIRPDGTYLVEPKFDDALDFREGFAAVKLDGQWGHIRPDATYLVEPKFDEAIEFQEGFAAVKLDGKWGYIKSDGTHLVEPKFDDAWDFSEGFAKVEIDGKYGYIKSDGTYLVDPKFDNAKDFSEGFARVEFDGKWGYIKSDGTYLVDPKFRDAGDFSEGFAKVELDWEWGYIRTDGTYLVEPKFDNALDFRERFAGVKLDGKWGYIKSDGTYLVEPKFDDAWDFSEGFARVELDGKWGYIKSDGTYLVEPKFDGVEAFSEGFAGVKLDGKWGFIGTDGIYLVDPKFDDTKPFRKEIAPVKLDGKWGYIKLDAKNQIEPKFRLVPDFSEGVDSINNNIDFEKFEQCVTFSNAEEILYGSKPKMVDKIDFSIYNKINNIKEQFEQQKKFNEVKKEAINLLESINPIKKEVLKSDSILFSFYPVENLMFKNTGNEKQYDPIWYVRDVLPISKIREGMPYLPLKTIEIGPLYWSGYMAEVFDWKTAIEEGKPNLFIEAEAREGTENKMDMLDNFVATMLLAFPPNAVRFNILEGNHPVNPFLRKLPDKLCRIYDVTSDSDAIRSLVRRLKSTYSDSRENPVPDCQPREFVVIAGYDRKDRNFTKLLEELRGVIENGKRAGIYFAILLSDDILNYDWSEEQVSDVFDSFTPYSTIMKCEKGDDGEDIWIPDYGLLRSKAIVPTDEGEVEGTLGDLIIKALHDMTATTPNKVYDKLQDGSLYESAPISDLENQPKADMGKLVVPIAESESGDIINLKLDDEGHIFYFILGKSGSGKSFTLHTILTNLMLKYDPSAVEVILMDFKPGGVEMNYYKDVPHVSSLLVNGADRQVAGEILQSIIKEMARRGEVFQKYGTSSISRYNDHASKNGLEQMRHIVLLVDECQDLFKIGNPGADTNIVTEIARKGRSYGIHMILATQTLQGADIPGDALKQFTDFLFMLCSEDDVVKCEVRDRDVQNRVGKLAKGEVIYVHQGGQEAPRHGFVYNYYGKDGEFSKKTRENLLSDRFTNPDKKQFYFNASQIYHLNEQEIKKLVEVSQSGLNPAPRAVLGKNLSVKGDTLYAKFGKGDDANLLILGANNRLQAERVLWNAVDSLYQANLALGNAARYYILPNIPEDVDEEAVKDHKARLKMVREIADRNGVVLVDEDERSEIIERVAATVRVRQQLAEEDRKALKELDSIYLIIPNQQLFSKKMGRRPKGLETLDRNLHLKPEATPTGKPTEPVASPSLEIDDFGFEGLIMPGEEPKAETNVPSFLDIDFDTFDIGGGFEQSNSSGKGISSIQTPKPGRDLDEELRYILEDGPSVKVHVILQSASPDKIYADDTMREKEMNTYFHDIVLLFMQHAESMSLPVDGSKVRNLSADPKSLRAIAYSGSDDARTVVPFDFPRD